MHYIQEEKEKTEEVNSAEKENLLSGMYFSFNPNFNNKSPPRQAVEKETPEALPWKDFFIKFFNQALLDSYDGIVKTQVLVDLIILQECNDLMKSSSSKLEKNYEQQNLRYLELEKILSKLAIQNPQVIDYEDICQFFDNDKTAVVVVPKKKELSPCQEEVSLENIQTERKPKTSAIRIINSENRQSSDSLSTIKHDSYVISGFENGGISRNITEITRFSLNNTVTDDAFQSMLFPTSNASSPTGMGEFNLKDFEAINQPFPDEHNKLSRNPSQSEQRQTAASPEISSEFKSYIQEIEAMNCFVNENRATLQPADLEIVNQINRHHELVPSENWETSIRLALKRSKHPDLHNSKVFPAIKRVLHQVQVFKLSLSELSQNSLTGLLGINLKVLNLSRNNIQNLKFLISCRNLEFINLSHNQLTTVEGFILCPNLQEIILSNNKITSIKTLARCSNLRLLDLSFNKLQAVEQLQKLSLNNKLSVLNLNGNEVIWEKGYKIKLNQILPNLRTLDPSYIIDHSNYKSFEEYAFNLKWTNPADQREAHSATFSQLFSDDSLLLRKIQSDFSFPQTVAI